MPKISDSFHPNVVTYQLVETSSGITGSLYLVSFPGCEETSIAILTNLGLFVSLDSGIAYEKWQLQVRELVQSATVTRKNYGK